MINYNFPQSMMENHWATALFLTIQGLHWGLGKEWGWGEREHACEGEAGGQLTWRVNALWGPGMGSFSVGAGTDKHTVSFSAVRAAGDCKSRNVPEPLPALSGSVRYRRVTRDKAGPVPQVFPPTLGGQYS